jgi:histone H3/H4
MSAVAESALKLVSKNAITKHAISRLARVAGVKSLSGLSYEELRLISAVFLENVLSKSIAFTEHAKRKMLSRDDVLEGLRLEDYPIYESGQPSGKTTKSKPEERAIREIKYIPKLVIERVVKEIGHSYKTNIKFESNAIRLLHFALESYLVKLMQDAQLLAIHAKRESVQPKDIQLVRTLRRT